MSLTDVQLGVVGASFMWVYAAAAPIAGIVGDRFARKTIIVGGLIFWSLITVATALSTGYSQLVFCRALEGLGEAFYFPASMSMLSDYHGSDTRSRAMSIHQSSVYAGTIAGGTVAGVMGQWLGWRSSFYLFDANIWASLHDVVPVQLRATSVGLMNAVGWMGGGFAPVAIAIAAERYGMSAAISAGSAIYLVVGLLLVAGAATFMRPVHA